VSRNEIILGLVALVLVVFSLVVSLVAPRRWPDFPGNRLGAFALVSVVLVVAMLGAVELFGDEHAEAEEEAAHVESGAPEEEQQEGETDAGPAGDAARGRQVFDEAGCGGCHVLEDAGTTSTVGPNLDDARPTFDEAVAQIADGGGGMPAFRDELSDEDIRAVAAYVVESTQ
jgi:mono/diheme cytochrome c family protein